MPENAFVVLAPEPPLVTGMRIQCAEHESRLGDAEGPLQSLARDPRGARDQVVREPRMHLAERDVRRGKDHAQRGTGEHHRGRATGEGFEHLRVSRIVVAAGEQCRLVDRRGHDALHRPRARELDRARDRLAGERTGPRIARAAGRGVGTRTGAFVPGADRFVDRRAGAGRADHHETSGARDLWGRERLADDLGADPARVAQRDGERDGERRSLGRNGRRRQSLSET